MYLKTIIYLLMLILFLPSARTTSITFDRNLVGVWFEPWIFREGSGRHESFAHDDLVAMTSTIASRFSIVMLRETTRDGDVPNNTYTKIPPAIATFNKNNRTQQSQPPMKAMITWSPLRGSPEHTHFEHTKAVVTQANHIFPGTVSFILMRWDEHVDEASAKVLLHKLEYAQANLPPQVRLGCYLKMSTCEQSNTHLKSLLNQSDLVIFSRWTYQEEYDSMDADRAADEVIRDIEKCKEVISKLSRKTTPGFITEHSDKPAGNYQNYTRLVQFWRRMNGWASQSSTMVILFEAFDNYNGKPIGETNLGWWYARKVRNGSKDMFWFEEKINHQRTTGGKVGTGMTTKTILIAAVTGLLVLGIVSSGMFLMYKRIMGRIETTFLSKEDVREFFYGGDGTSISSSSHVTSSSTPDVARRPYNQSLEMALGSFKIDNNSVLGIGTFGVVLRGCVTTRNGEEISVAVKMAKAGPSPSTGLKGLLSEIKVLDYVGAHSNMVALVGAYTAELARGKILVFLEFCPNGSLLQHLRSFANEIRYQDSCQSHHDGHHESDKKYANLIELPEPLTLQDLHEWTFQIACGMEYLASKNVVHSDLATRNVLLTGNNTAKISDFGLSRRLYDYTNYVKKQQEPLPWRWMAPESLRRLEFNEKTDVWSFGVTMWEIYSLGDVPYPGMSWDVEFARRLEQGLSLDRPKYATPDTYNIILKCLKCVPSRRPSFSHLREMTKH